MPKQKIKLYECQGQIGFDSDDGFFITDPFVSECMRFTLDPIKDYGLTKKQLSVMIKKNNLSPTREYLSE